MTKSNDICPIVERRLRVSMCNLIESTEMGELITASSERLLISYFPAVHRELLTEIMEDRNGKVVSFNETLTALRGCNTAIYVLSSGSAAKTALFYLIKYAFFVFLFRKL